MLGVKALTYEFGRAQIFSSQHIHFALCLQLTYMFVYKMCICVYIFNQRIVNSCKCLTFFILPFVGAAFMFSD